MNKIMVSYNVAAWRWRISKENYKDRLKRSFEFIKKNASEAFVIGLQEIILGEKYLELMKEEFPSYKIVLPKGYDLIKNSKSAISVLLISANGLQSYSRKTLHGLEDSARYNYVTINTEFGCYRVLNINIPQTAFNSGKAMWYQQSRKNLKKLFETTILSEAENYCLEKDINFIVMGDTNCSVDDSFIVSLADNYKQPMMEAIRKSEKEKSTWKNKEVKCENCLDHIYYSMGMLSSDVMKIHFTEVLDQTILLEMSDHAVIKGSFDTYIDVL